MNTTTKSRVTLISAQQLFYSFDDDDDAGKSDALDVTLVVVVVVFIVLLLSRLVIMDECVEQAAVFPKEEEGKSAILFRVCKNPKYNVTKESHEKEKKCSLFGE